MAEAEQQGQSRLRAPFQPAQRTPEGQKRIPEVPACVPGSSPVLALLASWAWPARRLDATFWDLIQMPPFPT